MHFGVITPNFGEYSDPRLLAAMAREAEEAGWEGFFIWDQITMNTNTPQPVCDTWMALALIAYETKRIKIGPMVTPLPRRRPTKLARETVTLDRLSGGRMILGVGLGALQYEEFEALGDEPDQKTRGAMLDEGLEVLTRLWSGEPVQYDGEHYHIANAQFLPKPVQQPRIPIWVAGIWPSKRPFRRSARWDGVIPGWDVMGGEKQSPQEVRDMVNYIKSYRTTDESFDVVYAGKTTGKNHAADIAEVAEYRDAGATWWLEDLNPWRGSIQEMRERLRLGPTPIES